jgi:hypothetical protein
MPIEKDYSKYRNVRVEYNGVSYQSKKECAYAQELDLRKRAGDIKSWVRQVKIDLTVNGKHITNYFIDFLIMHNDDSFEYVEVKGYETEEWKLKWKIFNILYENIPNTKLTLVK